MPAEQPGGERRSASGGDPGLPSAGVLLAVGVGGAAGAFLRAVGLAVVVWRPGGFPVATFLANTTGALLLGVLLALLGRGRLTGRFTRPFLAAGLLGSYTTFSSFAVELAGLVEGGAWAVAGLYAGATLLTGLGAALLGLRASPRIADRLPSDGPAAR